MVKVFNYKLSMHVRFFTLISFTRLTWLQKIAWLSKLNYKIGTITKISVKRFWKEEKFSTNSIMFINSNNQINQLKSLKIIGLNTKN
jgi:predicted MPP superfamily phosphohydrolase